MSVGEKFELIADEVYEVGKQDEQRQFWETFQQGGNRTDYGLCFGGMPDELYNPIYPIKGDLYFAFSRVGSGNTTVYIKSTKVPLIPTSMPTLMRWNTWTQTIPELDFSNISATTTYNSSTNPFVGATNISSLNVTGVIKCNGLDLSYMTKLPAEDLMKIVNALEDKSGDTSGTVWKITFASSQLTKIGETGKAIMKEKGWTY